MISVVLSLLDLLKPESIIQYGGLTLLLIVIFAESGLFFGFFLPGDSLLFVAGLLCKSHLLLEVWVLIIVLIIAAFLGSLSGYGFGRLAKKYLENKKDSLLYKRKYLDMTQNFYEKHGMMAFIMGRFLPIIRTFIPILAGFASIEFPKFLYFSLIGICFWIISMVMAGHLLGNAFPNIVNYLEIIVVLLIILSTIPVIITWIKNRTLYKKEEN